MSDAGERWDSPTLRLDAGERWDSPTRRLDGAFQALRRANLPERPLFDPLPGGPVIHADPGLAVAGTWASPTARIITIATTITTPGGWLALHLPLPADWPAATWVTLIARTSAATATLIRPCLRSGRPDGFHDTFFPRAILAQGRESDHLDLITLAQHPDLTAPAPWRDLILFLPPATDAHVALHDLRLILT
jgi:hypothetical protein